MNKLKSEIEKVAVRVWEGARITIEETLLLYELPLHILGELAHKRRLLAKASSYNGRGNEVVTYIVDRNINYTNICASRCKFCAFWRSETDPDAYVISYDELDKKIEETVKLKGSQILLQGGLHPSLPLEWYLNMLSHIRKNWPQINIHGFSPPELIHLSNLFKIPLDQLIVMFKEAGLGSIPGGGAEILVDRVRSEISPYKCSSTQWFEVMEIAHRVGLRSTATMMFGHIETIEERLQHLEKLRQLQEKTSGFIAFIPWTFQPTNTKLPLQQIGAAPYLRMLAISRIYLDNFENIQTSWVTQGPLVGQVGLLYGANDMGSIMIEENVIAKTGVSYRVTVEHMHQLIREAGFIPVQRDTWYNPIYWFE